MKKLAVLAFAMAGILGSASGQGGQTSISIFGSRSFETKGAVGIGTAVSQKITPSCVLGAEYCGFDYWHINSSVERVVALETAAIQFGVTDSVRSRTKFFFVPSAGVLAGFGTPLDGQGSDELDLLPHPYFLGVYFQANQGIKISPKFLLSLFVKFEGMVGIIRSRSMINEAATSGSNVRAGLTGAYLF